MESLRIGASQQWKRCAVDDRSKSLKFNQQLGDMCSRRRLGIEIKQQADELL